MNDLERLLVHCRQMAEAKPGQKIRVSSPQGRPDCLVDGSEITGRDRELWRQLGAQISRHLRGAE